MIYLYLFGTCFHFIYVFMIIGKIYTGEIPLVTMTITIPSCNSVTVHTCIFFQE